MDCLAGSGVVGPSTRLGRERVEAMQTQVAQRKILFLQRPGAKVDDAVAHLVADGALRIVHSFDEALAALRLARYDLVVSDQGDFLALERAAINQQAAMILETIGQGVCIVDPSGRLVWANPRMRSYPEDLTTQVCDACTRSFAGTAAAADIEKSMTGQPRARRLALAAGNDMHFEATITPVVDANGHVTQIAAVVWDVTHNRRLQQQMNAIELAGRELVGIDAETTKGMTIEGRIALLEKRLLKYMHDLLHFDNFPLLLIDNKSNRLVIILQSGTVDHNRDLDLYALPDNNGISGYVAAMGRSYICPDTSKDPRYLTGLESARSSLTVPLRLHDKVIGVFDIESDKLAAFNEDDRQYAEILAGYVAIALNVLDLLVTERYESTGRMADDVSAEIAGPLNDIVSEASSIVEEYIGNDDLRARLNAIIDNVAEIKKTIREVAAPKTGILGRCDDTAGKDPLLDGKRVLVADDEEIIRDTIGGVLRKAGCIVSTATDGLDAVNRIAAEGFDLVLADIKMPNKNGYEVFAAARDSAAKCPVILMTGFGYDPNHSIVRARREGLGAVLFKPFKVDQLLNEIRSALTGTPQQ